MPEEPSRDTAALDDAASVFLGARPRLFGIAYRMLGSATEAEDLLQDVWLKWQATDHTGILEATAFLSTITIRLAINVVQSARSRRETYIGPWLPEPVDTSSDPELGAVRGEALQLAVLLLLEKLTPTERASYVLREAFDYSYREIADILQLSEANTRQLVTRARKHIADERRTTVSAAEQRRLLETFLTAAREGDTTALENLFAADVVSWSDGGGVARAARIPIIGRSRVADFITAFASHFWIGVTVRWVEANGQASALVARDGIPLVVATVDASPDGIYQILWIMNPAKLTSIAASSAR